jgi:hypothetical protein
VIDICDDYPSSLVENLFVSFAELLEKKEGEPEAELPLWEADWEDEDVGGDFVQHLKEELGQMTS